MHTRIDAWALSLVTDPARAAATPTIARQRAWMRLMAQRGQTCRYPWLPTPRRTSPEAVA